MDTSLPTPSELLHSFLEGEPLDQSMETTLFSSLNSSAELRSEMRDMIALSRAVREDKVALVPPIASTAAVFGALGMSTSMLVQSGWLSTLWSKMWIPLAAGIVSSAVTWYAVSPSTASQQSATPEQSSQNTTQNLAPNSTSNTAQNTSQNSSQSAQDNTAQSSSQANSSSLRTSASAALGNQQAKSSGFAAATVVKHDTIVRVVYRDRAPAVAATERAPRAERENVKERIVEVVKNVYVPVVDAGTVPVSKLPGMSSASLAKTATNTAAESVTQNANSQLPLSDNVSMEPRITTSMAALTLRKINPLNLGASSIDAVNASAAPEVPYYEPPVFKPSSSAYLRALSGTSLVSVSVPADNAASINNVALGFKHSFNEYFSAGAELGSESIAMKFSGVVDGSLKRYEANPALTWAAVFGQVNIFPSLWNSGWQPFLQVNLGGTNYGFLPKAILGTNISPTAGLRMMIGAEASTLLYNVQSTSYRTFKIGYTYGIGYQF